MLFALTSDTHYGMFPLDEKKYSDFFEKIVPRKPDTCA
jgi:hypothetical protein